MTTEPFISVVIPTYNREQSLPAAIASVLAQTYRAFEIVVVDDGSTDRTAETVEKIIIRNSKEGRRTPRIHYVFQSNTGQSAARNQGIAEAKGNWIAFLDSDDFWLPEKLMWQVQAIDQFGGNCGACFSDARLVDSKGFDTTAFRHVGWQHEKMIGFIADPMPLLSTAFGIWVQTLVVRSDLAQKIGGFDPDLHFGEDYDFLFRLALETPYCYVDWPLAVIERTNTTIDPTVAPRDWDKPDFRLREQVYMYEKWLNRVEHTGDVRRTIVRNLRDVHSRWANWYLETGQFDQARRAVSTAMKYQPTPQLAVKWVLTWATPRIARTITPKARTL